MVKPCTHQRGVTLIELMIVILIGGILALVAMPFTGAWVGSTQVHTGKSSLQQAWGQAKALALRNAKMVTSNEPAAELFLDTTNKLLIVCPALCDDADAAEKWSMPIPEGITIEFTDPASSSIRFTNTGQLLDSGDMVINTHQVTYKVSKGSEEDVGILY